MGEGEYQSMYDYGDDDVFGDADVPPSSLLAEPGIWITRDGRRLEIAKMATAHLALFTKAGWGEHMKIRELREERARR